MKAKRIIEGTPYCGLKFDLMSSLLLAFAKEGPLTLLTHARPDGDCIGSAFALQALLRQAGCESRVVCPDPLPDRLAFLNLSGQDSIEAPAEGAPYGPGSRAIALDIAAPSLLGQLEGKYRILLSIDHHANSTPFADSYADPEAAATGEIVWRIARNWQRTGVISSVPNAVAYAVYASVSSDTGCFRYSNVTPATHRIAAQLISLVQEHAEIDRRLFEVRSPARIAAEKAAIEVLQVVSGGRISLCAMSEEQISAAGIHRDELDALIDVARSVDGIAVAVSVRGEKAGEYRVSVRSNTDADAAAICAVFGGGGHLRAAGCTVRAASLEEASAAVIAEIEKRI